VSYGEVFSPYINSLSAAKTYGELVKRFYHYVDADLLDVIFTTHDAHDQQSSKFFSRFLGFRGTDSVLRYGEFGGNWDLIYSTKKNFTDGLKMNFVSQSEVPAFISSFF
jgi:hypothetical protein